MSNENFNTSGTFGQAKDLKNRILFTVLLLIIYRLGTYVPLSGIENQTYTNSYTNVIRKNQQ